MLGLDCCFKIFIKKEIFVDVEKYGDDRWLFIVECGEVKVLFEKELVLVELVIVVFLEKGWVCCVKGYDIDVEGLSYKVGDGYLFSVEGKSN